MNGVAPLHIKRYPEGFGVLPHTTEPNPAIPGFNIRVELPNPTEYWIVATGNRRKFFKFVDFDERELTATCNKDGVILRVTDNDGKEVLEFDIHNTNGNNFWYYAYRIKKYPLNKEIING